MKAGQNGPAFFRHVDPYVNPVAMGVVTLVIIELARPSLGARPSAIATSIIRLMASRAAAIGPGGRHASFVQARVFGPFACKRLKRSFCFNISPFAFSRLAFIRLSFFESFFLDGFVN